MSIDNGILKLNKGFTFKYDLNNNIISYAYYLDKELNIIKSDDLELAISNIYDIKIDEIRKFISYWYINSISTENIISLDTSDGKKYFRLEKYSDNDQIIGSIIYQPKNAGLFNLIDPLTGVYQRSSIEEIIKNEIENGKRPFSLMIIDIDNFKEINDNYGHQFGDKIITEIIKLFKENLNDAVIGRIGGDEFVIMLYGDNDYNKVWEEIHKLYKIAEKYSGGLNDIIPFAMSSSVYASEVKVLTSFTCGISRYPFDGDSYELIFSKADRALYRGKRKSKNCFIIYLDEKHKNIDTYVLKRNEALKDELTDKSLYDFYLNCFSIIDRSLPFNENIADIAKYTGKYFLVDRVSIYAYTSDNLKKKCALWFDSSVKEATDEYFPESKINETMWNQHFIGDIVKMNKVSLIKDINSYLYNILSSQNTKSLLYAKLVHHGTEVGEIRLDICKENYAFNNEESKAFRILVKLLSLYIYNLNIKDVFEKEVLYDKKTNTLTEEHFISKSKEILNSSNNKCFAGCFSVHNLEQINDNYGYIYGDAVLQEVSNILKKHFFDAAITRNGNKFLVLSGEETDFLTKFDFLSEDCRKIIVKKDEVKVIILCGYYFTDGTENNITGILERPYKAYKYIKGNNESLAISYDLVKTKNELLKTV